jgi:hypothetical protein
VAQRVTGRPNAIDLDVGVVYLRTLLILAVAQRKATMIGCRSVDDINVVRGGSPFLLGGCLTVSLPGRINSLTVRRSPWKNREKDFHWIIDSWWTGRNCNQVSGEPLRNYFSSHFRS